MVHGDNVEFGDEVNVTLVAKAPEPVPVPVTEAEAEEKPSDCRLVSNLEEPLNETNGDTFYVDQDDDDVEQEGSDAELDLSVNSWTVVDHEAPAAEAPCEAPGGPEPKLEIDEDDPKAAATPPRVLPALTEEEVRRNFYNKQVYMSRYDLKYKDNLVALMKAGCTDFEANLQTLRRHGNKFDPSVADLLRQIE